MTKNQNTIEERIVPLGRFNSVRFDGYTNRFLMDIVKANVGNRVLVSDHSLLTDSYKKNILASDGVYFFGRITDFNVDGYTFRDKDEEEHSLKYSDLSGILTLDGSLGEDIPGILKKYKGPSLNIEKRKLLGQLEGFVLVDVDSIAEDGEYVIAQMKGSDEDSFTLGIDVLRDCKKIRKNFTFNYDQLAGLLVPVTQDDLTDYDIDSRFY
jgi:hypothetical protein